MGVSIATSLQIQGAANVLDYGATGNGSTDDTAAFQAALAANPNAIYPAYQRNGTLAQYVIHGQVTIPINGSLTGPNVGMCPGIGNSYYGTDSGSSLNITLNPSTIPGLLLITGNSGSASATSPFTLQTGSTLQGFCAYWPNQAQLGPSSSAPTAYPYFATMGVGANATIRNGCVINPYQFLNIAGMWRATVCDIIGQPYAMGILVTNSYDVTRIERVHFECFWDAYQAAPGNFYQPWTLNTGGVAYQFERADLLNCVDTFAYGYKTGMLLTSQDGTSTNSPWISCNQTHFDGCNAPLVVQYIQSNCCNFSNCSFTALANPVLISSTCSGPLMFTGCYMISYGTHITQNGSGDTIVTGCTFNAVSSAGTTAIAHNGGGMLISGNSFKTNTVQYTNAAGALWANVVNNRCKTSVSITNTASIAAFSQANNLAY
jgi:hypothetical protein